MAGTLRSKTFDIRLGSFKQLKLVDITDPVRIKVVSGTVTVEHYFEGTSEGTISPAVGDVYTAPDGAWGSEVRITATSNVAIVKVSYTG